MHVCLKPNKMGCFKCNMLKNHVSNTRSENNWHFKQNSIEFRCYTNILHGFKFRFCSPNVGNFHETRPNPVLMSIPNPGHNPNPDCF